MSKVVDGSTTECCSKRISYGAFGIAAAVCHITTIQPLFFMMALPSFAFGGAITVIFLMPTFMLYIVFSSSDPQKVPKIIQAKSFGEMNFETNIVRNNLLRKLVKGKKNGVEEMGQYSNPNDGDEEQKESTEPNKEVIDELAKVSDSRMDPNDDNAFDRVINEGLIYTKLNKAHNGRRAIKIVTAVAFTCCALNSIIVLFSPCYAPPDCTF